MSDDERLFEWDIWVRWQARSDWTVTDGAERLAEALRLIHKTWPAGTAAFKVGSGKQLQPVDDPDLAKRLAPRLKASRNRNLFTGTDLLGDASAYVTPAVRSGFSIHFQQIATGAGWTDGEFDVRTGPPRSSELVDATDATLSMMADLAATWQARNAWIDMVHVRQDWNQWSKHCPVYGWATWLHPSFATVDTTGLDVDASDAAGGGKLITLRVDPVEMADRTGTTGKDTVRALAARTVLADGRRLVEVNDRLRAALAAEGVR